ncbi:undecaprenyldiphospho-muramoylpentapeptide beta-N-acetylglucosaminyltransferase [Ferrimonas sediminicola]|uniref:UDP-N-acetylglucosamine--N-acetylmuramyl-(pentapeptide) pyrophosphoryl-undecaprenol N-acetylglucosamine transferase n=1 Tax=Ferrimonas sediminicola TaxID=2569538 RepID=A0A4U1BII2_9GAMM|nr:undecaprenyldiphospho-muramoylpentapeptide beta-N-acetylglucosaminyltransferase [Ferrimonas sediminicola]TKB51270.1 undecaprenyldiphospho-muramoylpentapeptide beta-N-acetylglucosaminyltransferase [Ferrimonas sediminicola]
MTAPKRLMVMAGGTGGHVFPALAVARRLQEQGWQVSWLGTADRMEARVVPQHGFEIDFIDIQGVRGNGLLRKLKAPLQILKAVYQSWCIQRRRKPDVVLGMGGYAAGPGGIAAWLRGTPVVLHEQNAVAGATNRILARFASRILCAFDGVFPGRQARRVGNPVREELLAVGRDHPVVPGDQLKVLIVGGSLGAKVLNETLPQAAQRLGPNTSLTVWHQVGRGNEAATREAWQTLAPAVGVQVSEFIDDMAAAYTWADLVICRAGALTVAELAACGRPAILVPFPHAVDDHQTKNSEALVAAGAAKLMPQSKLTPSALACRLTQLAHDSERLTAMARAATQVAVPQATQLVAEECIQAAGGNNE